MRARVPRTVYALLFLYIAISLGYEIVATISMSIGFLDLRHQVQDPHLDIDAYSPVIASVTDAQRTLGLAVGDRVETIDGAPYTGRAQLQADRWYAHPGETLRIGIGKPDGKRAAVAIPLTGFNNRFHLGQTILVFGLILVVPLVCLLA